MTQDKIVIVNQSSGYLMRDIAKEYKDNGFEVVLMTAVSKNNINIGLAGSGVKVDSLIAYDKGSSLKRLWTWGIATMQIWWKLIFKYKGYELLIVSNPPFAPLIPIVLTRRFSLLIYDIYPDVLLTQHVVSEINLLIKWWRQLNKVVFKKAEKIYTISEGMKCCLEQYSEESKIKVVPLWPDTDSIKRIEKKDNLFIKQHHLEGKFVVMYSGNMGNTHRAEVLIDVAQKIDDDDILFVLIGNGKKKKHIEQRINSEHCKNVLLLPFQSYDFLSHSLSAADIGVVTLDTSSSQMSVPSKTFNLMIVGAVLMCIASTDSELGNLVKQYEFGGIFIPDDINGMVEFIKEMKSCDEKRKKLMEKSVKASSYFSAKNAQMFLE